MVGNGVLHSLPRERKRGEQRNSRVPPVPARLSSIKISLPIESGLTEKQLTRGSAHLTDFAQQSLQKLGTCASVLPLRREKVSAWELSDDSCSAFVRTQLVGENEVFPTGSERFLRLRHLAANDVQVAVAAAEGVNELLFDVGGNEGDVVVEVIQTAHAGGADRNQLSRTGILREQVLKQTGVVQIFRDGDLGLLLLLRPAAEGQRRVDEQQQAHRSAGHDRDADVAHAGRETKRHGEEDAGDVARRAGCGAEADEAERAGHRNACAEVAVDEQDDFFLVVFFFLVDFAAIILPP